MLRSSMALQVECRTSTDRETSQVIGLYPIGKFKIEKTVIFLFSIYPHVQFSGDNQFILLYFLF